MSLPDPHASRELRFANEEALGPFAEALARGLGPLWDEGLVLDLRGDLGVGKTTLVRALARALGLPSEERVTSPTFSIASLYLLPEGRRLAHLDAYRLEAPEDLESVGFETYCGKATLTCVEWGSRVEEALPVDRIVVQLVIDPEALSAYVPGSVPEGPRVGAMHAYGPRSQKLLQGLPAEACVGA